MLANAGAPLGVVSSIVGYAQGELVFDGEAGHAGTTPMDVRQDALVDAAEAILRIRDAARSIEGAVATVGQISVEPAGSNVIPARAVISVDARAPDAEKLDDLVRTIGVVPGQRTPPTAMDEVLCRALRDEIEARGVPVVELSSGAGHDAGILAAAGVPSAMLFVRSLNGGISHSPDELSSEEDVALGVEVLSAILAQLATSSLNAISWAPSQSKRRPSSRRFSLPSTIVAKWLPASAPALLANAT